MKKIKFLVLGLFCLFGLISFSNARLEYGLVDCSFLSTEQDMSGVSAFSILLDYGTGTRTAGCNFYSNGDFIWGGVQNHFDSAEILSGTSFNKITSFSCYQCNNVAKKFFIKEISSSSSCPECQECETCPEVDTGSILSGYIAISDITNNYCISNGLCGEIATGMSTLYINDIWHESKPFIYVNIPDYLDWDYTGDVAQLFVNVNGYNTDADYMQSIIDINSYRPTSEDFTSIFVSGLTLIFPYLIFALFILFMRKLIKRIFKH